MKKEQGVFDAFTGATITPRAVITATRKVLEYAEANRETLFAGHGQKNQGGAP